MYVVVCIGIAIVLHAACCIVHGTSTIDIEPMYHVCMVYGTSSVPVPSISVLPAKYVIVEGNSSL